MKDLQGITVLVLGLGDSGLAMARWCARCGAEVRVWDSREQPPQAEALRQHVPQARLFSGPLGPDSLDGVQRVLKSPGLAPHDERLAALFARAAELGVPVQGELDLFAQALADLKAERGYAPKVIAITGTNGKTTTTSMAALLIERTGKRVAMAGNVGPTMLQTLSDALDLEPPPAAPAAAGAAAPDAAVPGAAPEAGQGPVAAVDATAAVGDDDLAATEHAAAGLPAGEAPAVEALAPEGDTEGPAVADDAAGEGAAGQDESASDATAADGAVPGEAARAAALLLDDDSAALRLAPPPPPEPVFEHLPQVWVLELSSFQLHGVQGFNPSAATVLNVTQDHLDWHGSMQAYAADKARVFGPDTVLVINRDDPLVEAMVPAPQVVKGGRGRPARLVERRVVRFGLDAPRRPGDYGLVVENGMAWLVRAMEADETLKLGRTRRRDDEEEELHIQRLMPADALRVRGRHNAANALAALALATSVGCPLAPMLHGLREYTGERHRVEYVHTVAGVDYFDDSKGTNVGATVAALNGLALDRAPARIAVILGGDGKGQDFSPLVEPVSRHARYVALIGRDAGLIEQALASTGVPMERFETLPAAVRACAARAHAGDAVLMSPACASLDMFRNYGHRGEVFVAEVQAMAAEQGEIAS
ncbi:UDP-N-acetylmuramoyl-L-alanine--D-glutamate ligase [Caldimonas thermodepolymerans]|jgi:UDP-N-acetylmuramoylalanine--D-glutamate ligase|uniref:UDP-N-acetylmuramoyl-L-alanine--D-glutamate ligase n=1 Tax=Caldimonas thermodepolymerans TaxID=215580 RepID=UPI00223579E1|nr:UDP-N-acetylmuramoyl-L-alanine--D-glutamate ligase [Caldimonas thermodepolymerans]UZG43610.1 UDP-N-acetylmuramoyl-L-alanine--D-glutamate ligase [Caldimonas thermodepolymerans]